MEYYVPKQIEKQLRDQISRMCAQANCKAIAIPNIMVNFKPKRTVTPAN